MSTPSSARRSWLTGSGNGLARRILTPWTCRKERAPAVQRRGGGGSAASLIRRRHQVHPRDAEDVTGRRVMVGGRRVWKNLFPVNGRSIHSKIY